MSTGRVPIAHPPGKETLADLCLASKGPKTKIPALMVFTKLYEANFLFCLELSMMVLFLSNFTLDPNDWSNVNIVSISLTLGRFFKMIFLFDKSVAARIGNEAFLEPEIFICPLSLLAPKTSSFCMIKL